MIASIQATRPMFGMGMFTQNRFSEIQKAIVLSILSNYNPKKITAEDAKAIFGALRKAGIFQSNELRAMIKSAGFDYQQLCQLSRSFAQSVEPS
jgi:hypothetical protein